VFFLLLKAFPCLSQCSGLLLLCLLYLLLLKNPLLLSLQSLLHLLLLNQLQPLLVSALHLKSFLIQNLLVLLIGPPCLLKKSLIFSFSLLFAQLNLFQTDRLLLCKFPLSYFIFPLSFKSLLLNQSCLSLCNRFSFLLLQSDFFLHCLLLISISLVSH